MSFQKVDGNLGATADLGVKHIIKERLCCFYFDIFSVALN
jgi:hypothetical protein